MLWQRAISSVFIVALTLAAALLGHGIFAVFVAAGLGIALREVYTIFRRAGHRPLTGAGYVTFVLALLIAGGGFWEPWGAGLIAALVVLTLLGSIFRPTQRGAMTDWALTVAGALYLTLPAVYGVLLRDLPGTSGTLVDQLDRLGRWQTRGNAVTALGLGWYLLAQVVTWLTDVGAYAVGRLWGRRKLAPAISPGKSVEGALGGLVAAGLAGWIGVWAFGLPLPPLAAFGVGMILGGLGQVGDLAESSLKRQAGVKDSGTLIPGHGGLLDRLDSLVVVVTATYFLARALQ